MTCNLRVFSKGMVRFSAAEGAENGLISRNIFQKFMVSGESAAEEYFWKYFQGYSGAGDDKYLNEEDFVRGGEEIFSLITDKEQIIFYLKVYSKGKEFVLLNAFMDFLLSCYQLIIPGIPANTPKDKMFKTKDEFDGKEWLLAIAKSCFHIKEEMSIVYIRTWIERNAPRLWISLHKFIFQQLTTGFTRVNPSASASSSLLSINTIMSSNFMDNCGEVNGNIGNDNNKAAELKGEIDPILLWLLSSSLPSKFISVLDKKGGNAAETGNLRKISNPHQFLLQLMNGGNDENKWTLLYNSSEHGSGVNRFHYHVFNYRGPTLMFIWAENGYTMMVASDTEWRESCHFWGGEDSTLVQLQPEFHIAERGPKLIYVNFSIRGYPFGIQIGKDPRNVSLEIKPDFEYAHFKKIPCKIRKISVWGCAARETKSAQTEFKKWEAKECEKQRKVNVNQVSWDDNPDKYLLELAGTYKSFGK